MRWLLAVFICFMPLAIFASDPTFITGPHNYDHIKYFYNEYSRERDGVYISTSTSITATSFTLNTSTSVPISTTTVSNWFMIYAGTQPYRVPGYK